MSRRSAVAAIAGLAAFLAPAGGAGASHSPGAGAGPPRDFAVGGGQTIFESTVGFSAHGGPSGEDARGHYAETVLGGSIKDRATVTCLRVAGNEGVFVSVVADAASNTVPPGTVQTTYVRDNDDLFGDGVLNLIGVGTPGICPPPGLFPPPLLSGQVVVHDGGSE
jgi:hypothetical protein